jgi:hypothetical protein
VLVGQNAQDVWPGAREKLPTEQGMQLVMGERVVLVVGGKNVPTGHLSRIKAQKCMKMSINKHKQAYENKEKQSNKRNAQLFENCI